MQLTWRYLLMLPPQMAPLFINSWETKLSPSLLATGVRIMLDAAVRGVFSVMRVSSVAAAGLFG